MAKTASISARVEVGLKDEVNDIFKKMGLSAGQAINLFYKMVKRKNGLPFDIDDTENNQAEIPNQETLRAIKEIEKKEDLVYCKDADDLFRRLEI